MGRALDASENWGYGNSYLLMCVREAILQKTQQNINVKKKKMSICLLSNKKMVYRCIDVLGVYLYVENTVTL